jgi:hypothetical protein
MGLFQIFSKIRGDIRERMFITGVNDTGDKLFTGSFTPPINLSSVSMTPANNPCHGFLLIAGVVLTGDNDTYDKFIAGDNDTGEQIYCQ